ncbi:hypothetical protein WRSd5_04109 [Shigella dysenteriae WRSd5]|nr:hypothetical protein WRSd5_04109 [Shigella dysenteriae WRSd5]
MKIRWIFFCMDKIIASKVCNNRECDEKSFITKPSWVREVFGDASN